MTDQTATPLTDVAHKPWWQSNAVLGGVAVVASQLDLVYDLRESAEAIEVIADFCRPGDYCTGQPAHTLTAAQLGPVLGILARTLVEHIDALEQALSPAKPA